MNRIARRPIFVAAALCLFGAASAAEAQSLLSWVDPAPGAATGVRIGAGEDVTIKAGSSGPVYGARARSCSAEGPGFERVMRDAIRYGLKQPPSGVYFDAGTGQRNSNSCNGRVGVRAVGYRPEAGYTGSFSVDFFGDRFTITVE